MGLHLVRVLPEGVWWTYTREEHWSMYDFHTIRTWASERACEVSKHMERYQSIWKSSEPLEVSEHLEVSKPLESIRVSGESQSLWKVSEHLGGTLPRFFRTYEELFRTCVWCTFSDHLWSFSKTCIRWRFSYHLRSFSRTCVRWIFRSSMELF